MADIVVHTIDSRGNVMLEVMQNYFGLNSDQLRREIVAAVDQTAHMLVHVGSIMPILNRF